MRIAAYVYLGSLLRKNFLLILFICYLGLANLVCAIIQITILMGKRQCDF